MAAPFTEEKRPWDSPGTHAHTHNLSLLLGTALKGSAAARPGFRSMEPEEQQQPPDEVEVEAEEVEEEEEYESDDTWESDVESEAEIAEIMQLDIAEESANTGKKEYLAKCVCAPSPPRARSCVAC